MKYRQAGWVVALAAILFGMYQQHQIQTLKTNERALGKEVFRLQAQASSAVKSFRQPLASTQPESWVAPLMRPVGGAK